MAAPLTGWFTKEAEKVGAARRRFFELRGAVVTYFERERDGKGVNKKGTIDITIGSNASGEGRDLLIQTPARTYVLKAEDAEVAKKWRRALVELIAKISATVDKTPISGWLLKEAEGVGRARRRFFVCEGAFVKYYDGENLAVALLKGRIKIGATSFISNEETRIKITNPEREWQLTAPDSITAARWVAELGDIRSSREGVAGPDDASDGDDEPPDDRFLMPGRGVWLLKDGAGLGGALRGPQRRFFALLYGSDPHMVKFAYFRGVESGQPRGLRGFVPIMPESAIEEAEGGIIIVSRHLALSQHCLLYLTSDQPRPHVDPGDRGRGRCPTLDAPAAPEPGRHPSPRRRRPSRRPGHHRQRAGRDASRRLEHRHLRSKWCLVS
jgi:hypothetical protein